jgi:hypothetical protein
MNDPSSDVLGNRKAYNKRHKSGNFLQSPVSFAQTYFGLPSIGMHSCRVNRNIKYNGNVCDV